MSTQKDVIDGLQCLGDLVDWGEQFLQSAELTFGHGTDNARDEAAELILHAMGLSPIEPEQDYHRHISEQEKQAAYRLLRERVLTRKPAAYLIREAWFAGLSFYVDERVLVPRSPIAELIESGLAPWVQPQRVHLILDLCTGSGCIGIACAYAFPHAEVDLSDISTEALDVAQMNIRRYGMSARVHAIQSNIYAQLNRFNYDVIIANPPYVDAPAMLSLPPEYKHEPRLGLAGGKDGLDVVLPILSQAADYLSPKGILITEVGDSETTLKARFPDVPFVWLEFERGGHGVFVLTKEQCEVHFQAINA